MSPEVESLTVQVPTYRYFKYGRLKMKLGGVPVPAPLAYLIARSQGVPKTLDITVYTEGNDAGPS